MRKIVIVVLFLSLTGLAFFQYELLKGSLLLSKNQFDEKMTLVLKDLEGDLSQENELTYLLGATILRDTSYFTLPSKSLLDTTNFFLSDFLKYRMEQRGVNTDFQYNIVNMQGQSLLNSDNYEMKMSKDDITYRLSLTGYFTKLSEERYFIKINILNAYGYFLRNLTTLFIPNLIFLILIIACSFWLIRVLYWEKQLNDTTHAFINNLTHELKTPVFSIALASRLLYEKNDRPEDKKLIKIIQWDNDRLKNHIDKVLALARLEKRQNAMDLKPVDFQAIFQPLVSHWTAKFEILDGQLSTENNAINTLIRADEAHLLNVFENILDNTVKYSSGPPIVTIVITNTESKLVIAITDMGIGIDKKLHTKVFDKFYRVPEKNDQYNVKGYGLGLNYAKQVLKLHKGQIKISSALEKGTTVLVYLPLR